jgi:DNA-binding transcriptional ArsR family regulator
MGMINTPRLTDCPAMDALPKEALKQIANYLQGLSEPTRLKILNLLRTGERNFGNIARHFERSASEHAAFMRSAAWPGTGG